MFNIQLNLRNPFVTRFASIKSWSGSTWFPNKFWELEFQKTDDLIDIHLRFTTKQSHAGLTLGCGILGYNLVFNFYDRRHWNNITDSWDK